MKRKLLFALMAIMTTLSYAQDVIMEAPDGVEKTYTRTGKTIDKETKKSWTLRTAQ